MNSRAPGPGWGRSFPLAKYFGIELRLHWSFLALMAVLGLSVLADTGSLVAVAGVLIPLVLAFLCVALHEYGHALTARYFGIRTRGITLLPIGGIAELERNPSSPAQEFWIALAGPAVNFALAGLLFSFSWGTGGSPPGLAGTGIETSVLGWLLRLNLLLGSFNLLPALPMDGGRILRAALALWMPSLAATRIAASIARGIAAFMVVFGLSRDQWMLALIGVFVWTAARAELRQARAQEILEHRLGQAFREAGADRGAESDIIEMQTNPKGEWTHSHPDRRKRRPE